MIGKAHNDPGLEISSRKPMARKGEKSGPTEPSIKSDAGSDTTPDVAALTTENFIDIDPFEPDNNIRKTAFTPPPPDKEWTVMVYMAGDNDLEPALVSNLKALEKVGSSSRINILAELDRGGSPRSPLSKWEGSRRFLIQKSDDPTRITSPVIEKFSNVNMSDPAHLADFVKWGMKNYPAKHYLLIINDHGYGFMGAADDKGNNDTMSLPKMSQAFSMINDGLKSDEASAGKKIDIVGFDACLMSGLEVAYELRNAADIMIASQEVIGSSGWPYGDFAEKNKPITKGPSTDSTEIPGDFATYLYPQNMALSTFLERAEKIIENTGELTPEAFARGIVTQCEKHPDTTPTMAAIRLGKYPEMIASAVKDLGAAIKGSSEKEVILDIVKNTQRFNKQAPDQNPYGDYRDLYDFCRRVATSRKLNDQSLKGFAGAVQKTIDEAILDRTEEKLLPPKYKGSRGVSIYMPDSIGETDYGYGEIKFEKDVGWLKSIREIASYDPEEKWETLYHPPAIKGRRRV